MSECDKAYALIEELAQEVEEWVNNAYPPDQRGYPSIAHRYTRDIEPVIRARKFLGLIE